MRPNVAIRSIIVPVHPHTPFDSLYPFLRHPKKISEYYVKYRRKSPYMKGHPMNNKLFDDKKFLLGFALSFLLSITAIILAANDIGYWVVCIVLAFILMFASTTRAQKSQ
jgi:hypothetical protein